ncbi:MAG: hypothetical protein ACRYFZ_09490 [Janthinobacterium lividum]
MGHPLIQPLIDAATAPLAADVNLLQVVAGVPAGAPEPPALSLPEQIAAVASNLNDLSGVANYPAVAATRTNMRSEVLRLQASALEQRVTAAEQAGASQQVVNDAQEALLRELLTTQGTQSNRLDELSARLDLVKAMGQNLAADLAANQAHDVAQDAQLAADESRLAATERAIVALQAHDVSEDAGLAANAAADRANAAQDAATQAVAAQALALGQAEHATNVAQQAQIDANTAQQALLAARQTTDEAAIAAAQARADQAEADAHAARTAAATAQAAATAAQTTATQAAAAAAAAQATATSAGTAAANAQTSANTAQAAATAAQAKANDDATAAANAQATANAAQTAAASNATALAAVQAAVAGKLDAALVRRGSVTLPGVTIAVATPATVQVTFATPFADANYEVFLSKPGAGLLGVELGWQNKTKDGFTLTERNTGLASLAVPAGAADYFAIHN